MLEASSSRRKLTKVRCDLWPRLDSSLPENMKDTTQLAACGISEVIPLLKAPRMVLSPSALARLGKSGTQRGGFRPQCGPPWRSRTLHPHATNALLFRNMRCGRFTGKRTARARRQDGRPHPRPHPCRGCQRPGSGSVYPYPRDQPVRSWRQRAEHSGRMVRATASAEPRKQWDPPSSAFPGT